MKMVKRNNKLRATFNNHSPEYSTAMGIAVVKAPPSPTPATLGDGLIYDFPNNLPSESTTVLRSTANGSDGTFFVQPPVCFKIDWNFDITLVRGDPDNVTIHTTVLGNFNGSINAPFTPVTINGVERGWSTVRERVANTEWFGSPDTEVVLPDLTTANYSGGSTFTISNSTYTAIPELQFSLDYFNSLPAEPDPVTYPLVTAYVPSSNTSINMPCITVRCNLNCLDGPFSYGNLPDPVFPTTRPWPNQHASNVSGYTAVTFNYDLTWYENTGNVSDGNPIGTPIYSAYDAVNVFLIGTVTVTPICKLCDCQPATTSPGILTYNSSSPSAYQLDGAEVIEVAGVVNFLGVFANKYSNYSSSVCTQQTLGPPCDDFGEALGSSGTFLSSQSGTLYALFNDTIGGFNNNSGSFNLNWPTGTLSVAANSDMGVAIPITGGTSYSYTAGGTAYFTPGGAPVGPDGIGDSSNQQYTYVPDAPFCCLAGIFVCNNEPSPLPGSPAPCDTEIASPPKYNVSGDVYSVNCSTGSLVETLLGTFNVVMAPDGDPATLWLIESGDYSLLPNGLQMLIAYPAGNIFGGSAPPGAVCAWAVVDNGWFDSKWQYYSYKYTGNTPAGGYPDTPVACPLPTPYGNGSGGIVIKNVAVTAI